MPSGWRWLGLVVQFCCCFPIVCEFFQFEEPERKASLDDFFIFLRFEFQTGEIETVGIDQRPRNEKLLQKPRTTDDHVQPIVVVTQGSMLFCHNHENDRPSSRLRNSIHQTWNSPITDQSILHLFAHHCQTAAPQWHDQGTFGTEEPQPVDNNSRYESTRHEPHSPPFRTHETIEWHASDSS